MRGGRERLRPILMTACAMIVGMVPMALALEAGSQMEAPLGRAVIGGLLVSTFATLLILPAVFAMVMGHSKFRSPSLHPDDPDSSHYDPAGKDVERDQGIEVRGQESGVGGQESGVRVQESGVSDQDYSRKQIARVTRRP